MTQSTDKKEQGLFFTQEDIDFALRGGDAPEANADADDTEALILDEADIVDPDSEDLEYFGLLSKEDIEALLHGDVAGAEGEAAQNEIDSLLATAGSEEDAVSPAADRRSGKGDVSQDDVEQLMKKTAAEVQRGTGTEGAVSPPAGPETAEGTEAVSQDDIDRLLMSAIDDPEPEDGGLVSQDDIDQLLKGGMDQADAETAPEEGGLVSQDDIDQLLKGGMDYADAEATPEDGGLVSQDDIDQLLKGGMDQADAETAPEEGGLVSQDDIDQLLKGSIDQTDAEAAPEVGGLVSQADLDQLMGEALSGGDAEGTSLQRDDTPQEHISQSDINRLLKESLEEEELPEEEEAREPEAAHEADADEPVILAVDEAVDESLPSALKRAPAPRPRKKTAARFKKKRLLAGVAAGVVFILAVSIAIMIPSRKGTVLKPQVLTFSIAQPNDADQGGGAVLAKNVRLGGFVVLAPPNSVAVTYMTGDLLLGLSEASLVDLIKENEAYVRDIVYGTINRELMTRDISTIDEVSLELAIRKELGRIIPRGAIEQIDFEGFSLA